MIKLVKSIPGYNKVVEFITNKDRKKLNITVSLIGLALSISVYGFMATFVIFFLSLVLLINTNTLIKVSNGR